MLSFPSRSWGTLRTTQITVQRPSLLIGKAANHHENHFGASVYFIEQGNCIVKHPPDHHLISIMIKDCSKTMVCPPLSELVIFLAVLNCGIVG